MLAQTIITKLMIVSFLLLQQKLLSQFPNIKVNKTVGAIEPEEITISINPTNPMNLVAGANIDYYYNSMDAGSTWVEGTLTSSLGVAGDPCVLFDPVGNLYYAHLSNPTIGYWLDRIVVQKSTDGCITWNDGIGIGLNPPKQQDKEWLAVDFSSSLYHNNIYLAWTEFDKYNSTNPSDSSRILFARSTDFSNSWSQPVKVSDVSGNTLDGDSTVEGAVPAVGPNGEVYLSWAGPLGIMFDKSTDGGVTFGKDIFVTSQPGGWDFDIPGIFRCNGLPVTACDISNSPHMGSIYILWSDQRNGVSDTDIFLKKSTDGGINWGETVRVNDDATTRHQFFPWITIDQTTGYLYVTFYDRRNTTGNATEVYLARSIDGGKSFHNFKISESPFIPDESVFFGDYLNVAARDGKIYPIWMRLDQTVLSVWIALIDDSMLVAIKEGYPHYYKDFLLLQNYPNPFNPSTTIEFNLPNSSNVTLKIFNILGEEVTTLVSERLSAGRYKYEWLRPVGIASGVYLYRLDTENFSQTRKMLLIQ